MQFLNTLRIGQITGSPNGDPSLHLSDPQGWPLLNDTSRWSALGLDEGANTEHQGRLYFFVGDVLRPDWWKTPLNNSHFVGWTEDTRVLRQGGHVPMGFNFVLPHDIGEDANHQGQWRYCVQCSGLFFDGYADKQFQNRCPQGGSHAPAGFNFVLPQHDYTIGQMAVAVLWSMMLPIGVSCGLIAGIETAAWKNSEHNSSTTQN